MIPKQFPISDTVTGNMPMKDPELYEAKPTLSNVFKNSPILISAFSQVKEGESTVFP